jgi:hypothetical protein
MILNKLLTPFFTIVIITNMFLKLGNFKWTGVNRLDLAE